jgi:hypothetical protein
MNIISLESPANALGYFKILLSHHELSIIAEILEAWLNSPESDHCEADVRDIAERIIAAS